MIKLFVSLPMKNLTYEEIRKRQLEALSEAAGLLGCSPDDIYLIDQYIDESKGDTPLRLLGCSIEKLSEADVVYFCEGWKKARGCIVEYMCSYLYGLKILV